MVVESPSLPTPRRFDIPFCMRREVESILTPNRVWLWGSLLPSWSTEHSRPGNGGNETAFWLMFVWRGPDCTTWGSTFCDAPEDRRGSIATRFGGHPTEVNKALDLGKLRCEVSSWWNEPSILCKGETTGLVSGFPFESEKLCFCMEDLFCNNVD